MYTFFSYYLVLLIVIIFIVMLARWLKLSYPLVLVCSGLLFSFIPGLPHIKVSPDVVFYIFLPPLLYEAAWQTSWKEFWKWRRVISTFAFGIVLITSCLIAFLSHAIIPSFTLAAGFLLGGIISPTDAIAATNILKDLKVPKRTISIIEGESLLNDATSLVIFRFALAAAVSGSFVFHEAAASFFVVIFMGIVIGLLIALGYYAIHRWLPTTPSIDTVLTLMAPYTMYVAAEQLHFSGVLAVVSGGLFLSSKDQEILSHVSRIQTKGVWQAIAFVMNALIFMLIGLELPDIVKQLGSTSLADAVTYGVIISVALILSRVVFTLFSSWFTKKVSSYITVADSNPGWRGPVLFGFAGMRGVVSLAAALSIPLLLSNGKVFPQRAIILFITFIVIIITLVLQGFALPLLVKWLKIKDPSDVLTDEEQEIIIRNKRTNRVLEILSDQYADETGKNQLLRGYQLMLQSDQKFLTEMSSDIQNEQEISYQTYARYKNVIFDLLSQQRALLKKMNTRAEFDDDIIRKQLAELDLEEEKLSNRFER